MMVQCMLSRTYQAVFGDVLIKKCFKDNKGRIMVNEHLIYKKPDLEQRTGTVLFQFVFHLYFPR